MSRTACFALAAVLATGCTAPATAPPSPPAQPAALWADPVFQPITADELSYMQRLGTPYVGSEVNTSAGANEQILPGSVSGNVTGQLVYPAGFDLANPEAMSLVAMDVTEAPGSTGPLGVIARDIVDSVLRGWVPGARMIKAETALGNDGGLRVDAAGVGGWRLTYQSPDGLEQLKFDVTPEKTLITKTRWAQVPMPVDAARLSEREAIARLSAAIADRAFKSEEERTGRDYFLGRAFAPPAPGGGISPGRIEVLYAVPEAARWIANFESVIGKAVWHLRFYTPSMDAWSNRGRIPPSPPAYSGEGLIDAESGVVIRFRRPYKRYSYAEPRSHFPF